MYNTLLFRFVVAILFLLPLGQLTRITLPIHITVYLHDIVIFVAISIYLLGIIRKKLSYVPTQLFIPIGLFMLTALVSLFFASFHVSLSQLFVSSLYALRWGMYASIFFVVLQFSPQQKKRILHLMVYAGILFALLGLVQYIWYPNLRNLYYAGWDPHLSRIFSTFFDPNFAGIYIVVSILLLLYLFSKKHRIASYIQIFILSITLLLTYSRSSYIAFLAGLFTLFVIWKKKWLFVGISSMFVIMVLFLPRSFGEGVRLTRISTIYSRFENWREAITIFTHNPVFGVGFNTYRYVRIEKTDTLAIPSHAAAGVDNSYLFVLATSGLVGFFSYMVIWLRIGAKAFTSRFTKKRAMVQLSVLVAIGVHALFVNTLFYPFTMIWMWIFLGGTYF